MESTMEQIELLIEENKSIVYSCLYKYGLQNDPDAESAGYWALYKAIITFDDTYETDNKERLLKGYMRRCVTNALGDHVRKLKCKRQLEVSSYNKALNEHSEIGDILSTHESVEDIVLKTELVDKTKQAVIKCRNKIKNEKVLEIVDYYIASGYSEPTVSIASALGISQSYVSQKLAEFRTLVKREMEEYYNVNR